MRKTSASALFAGLVGCFIFLACGSSEDDAGSAGAGGGGAGGSGGTGVAGGSFGGASGGATSGGGSGGATSGGGSAGAPSGGGAAGSAGGGTAGSGGVPSGGGAPSGGGGGTVGGAGGTGGTAGGCPTNSPPGPAVKRFDIATLSCATNGTCSGAEDKCFCQQDFDALNVAPPHYMGVGTDNHKAKIWAAGNFQAVYIDDLNTNWTAGGGARASAIMASAKANFPCGVPEYFILNEISASQWPSNATYRQFVVDVAQSLKNTHGKTPIVAAPFAKPGANAASWTELAKYAFIGAEVYLSGKEVNANGNSVTWCQAQYQAAITAYGALGVPKAKLYLFEHFANTDATVSWGRAGVSAAGWKNAITARSTAIKNLGFAGFSSYGWAGNAMHAPETDRLAFMALYNQQNLP